MKKSYLQCLFNKNVVLCNEPLDFAKIMDNVLVPSHNDL